MLIIPFHSALLQLKLHNFELILRDNPKNKTILLEKDKITWHRKNYAKMEIGLETIYQMAVLNILLLLSNSNTKTYTDPVQLLEGQQSTETSEETLFGLKIPQTILKEVFQILGYVSISFSLVSCVNSHLNVLTTERIFFPFVPKCVVGLSTLIAISKRLLSMVLFFAPTLGLFNLLYHWKAEQTKWHPALIQNFVDDHGNIQFGNSPQFPWTYIDRWEKNLNETPEMEQVFTNDIEKMGSEGNPNYYLNPPHYSLYTILSLKQTFFCFIGILGVHLIFIIFIKQKYSFAYNDLNYFELFIHGIENTNIPYNIRQWCGPQNGSSAEHRMRMISNRNEGIALIMISCLFNILHLGPLSILGIFS